MHHQPSLNYRKHCIIVQQYTTHWGHSTQRHPPIECTKHIVCVEQLKSRELYRIFSCFVYSRTTATLLMSSLIIPLHRMFNCCCCCCLDIKTFYPTSAVPPVSFLILHRREIQILWSHSETEKKITSNRSFFLPNDIFSSTPSVHPDSSS